MRLRTNSLVCRDALELFSAYIDNTLSRRDRRRYERHLAMCDACNAYLEQVRASIIAARIVDPDDLDPEVLEGLVDLFEKYRDEELGR